MKILFVNNFRGRGGGEEFLRDLLPGLLKNHIEVGLVCRPNTPLVEMFRDTGVALHTLDRSGIRGITSVFKIATLIRERGYELVNIQRGHDIIQAWLAACLSGRRPKLMYTPQVPEFIHSRLLLRRMHAIATISRHIRDGLVSFDPLLADRISIVYYGIDLGRFKPASVPSGWLRKRFNLPPATRIIGSVGDLWKNQIEFLDVLAELRKTIPDVRYAMVASESGIGQIDAFKRRAEELGLTGHVLWAGRLAKDDMLSFYADIDLAVSTYRNEGFGIWILEAMAMGKPVVAYNEGGIRDSLEGSPSGLLVNGGPGEMAETITGLLQDRDRYRSMAEHAPAWVRERFPRERMIDDYVRYFRGITGERKAVEQRPLRILHLISKNDRYGAQRIFIDQVTALRGNGQEVQVVARGWEGYVAESVRGAGIPYHGVPMKGFGDILFLRKLIRKEKIDIIHSTLDRADYIAVIASWITGIPVVSTMMIPRCHPGYRFMARVAVLSLKQKDILIDYGIDPRKIDVIRPGIEVERFARPDRNKREIWRSKITTRDADVVLCHISSIHTRKSHLISIDILAELRRRGARPFLFIVGDPLHGDCYLTLRKAIADKGLEQQVLFTGWTRDIPEILSLCHYNILPSEKEALGVVLMEGMAAGIPIVAREGEGGAELVQQYAAGFIYRPEQEIGELVDRLLQLLRDASAFQRLSEHCRTVAEREFTMTSFADRLMTFYNRARGVRDPRG